MILYWIMSSVNIEYYLKKGFLILLFIYLYLLKMQCFFLMFCIFWLVSFEDEVDFVYILVFIEIILKNFCGLFFWRIIYFKDNGLLVYILNVMFISLNLVLIW